MTHSTLVPEGALLWSPTDSFKHRSRMWDFLTWLRAQRQLAFDDYASLWRWSVGDLEGFWSAIAEYFGVVFDTPASRVLGQREMPGATWFEGARLNYTAQVFRNGVSDKPALVYRNEDGFERTISWAELQAQVGAVANALRQSGVQQGDRVAAYVPNIPEAVIAFLATASLGAIWSSCSPDFGPGSVVDRWGQIEPKVLFAVDSYRYNGRLHERAEQLAAIRAALPSVQLVVRIPRPGGEPPQLAPGDVLWDDFRAQPSELRCEPVAFDHPLWVLYSSGTTGLPKGIVHGHGGVVLEHLKANGLSHDVWPGDMTFWNTSTAWMVWNMAVGCLLAGGSMVLYDGHPSYPNADVLWALMAEQGATLFGTGAAWMTTCMKAGIHPGQQHDLSKLRLITTSGSPLPVDAFVWVRDEVKPDLWLGSVSGGTDIVSGFVGPNPLEPVYAGEIQDRLLAVDVHAFDPQGQPVVGQVGELVVTQPMPSMPVFLWNDPDGSRYRETYFSMYPGYWRHGDWIRFNAHGGSVIEGRSDSTLNRLGVRVGTAELYAAVESLPEVLDSLIVGLDLPDGGYYMPLFVVLAPGASVDDDLRAMVRDAIRSRLSPRYVPDAIFGVPSIPRTLTGKKLEVPVKRLFQGTPIAQALSVEATADPEAITIFADLASANSPLLPH